MKIGFVGAAGHYAYVLQALSAGGEFRNVGLAPGYPGENMEPLRSSLAEKGFEPESYADTESLFDLIRPDIAVVASRFDLNASVSIRALERGIHVFSEKPLATGREALHELKTAYDRAHATHGTHLAAMLGLRYDPAIRTAWQLVRAGRIGDVRLINAQKSYRFGQRSDFYKERDLYGGTIPWVGIHAIDLLTWFSGKKFISVHALQSRRSNQGYGDLEMTALCTFMMEDELLGSVTMDYLRPDGAKSHGDDRIRVVGTEGIVEVAGGRVSLIDKSRSLDGLEEIIQTGRMPIGGEDIAAGLGRGWERSIFLDFVNQVQHGAQCVISAENSFAATEAALLARQSADEGGEVILRQAEDIADT